MKITYWSDYACPYCYIGEARLQKAIECLGLDGIELEMKAFELDPTAPAEVTETTPDRFARKYGLSIEAARAQIEHICALGRAEGIDFNYETTQYTNTFDAHRLTKLACGKGAETAHRLEAALFDAYFTRNERLSDRAVLLRLAEGAGIPAEEAAEVLDSGRYGDEVRLDEREAERYGIHGVPYFLIDGRLAIPGAADTDSFVGALEQAQKDAAERDGKTNRLHSCGPDGCRIG